MIAILEILFISPMEMEKKFIKKQTLSMYL